MQFKAFLFLKKSTLSKVGPAESPVQFAVGLPAQSSVIDSLVIENELKIVLYADAPAFTNPSETFHVAAPSSSVPSNSAGSGVASAFGFSLFGGGSNSLLGGFLDSNLKSPAMKNNKPGSTPGPKPPAPPPPPPMPTDNPPLLIVMALYDFATDEPTDIKFNAGDLILVTMRPNDAEPNPQSMLLNLFRSYFRHSRMVDGSSTSYWTSYSRYSHS